MKRFLTLAILLFLTALALSAETVSLGDGNNSITLLSSSAAESVVQYRINKFDQTPVQIEGNQWFQIRLPKEGILQEKGFPELPVFNRSIIIDGSARMNLEVYDVQYQDLEVPVAPSRGVITRDIDPATVPYTFDKVYQSDSFYPHNLAELSEPYILRDFRGVTIKTTPFAYNPQTKVLRVFTSYKIRVFADGLDTINTLTGTRNGISRDFLTIYENHFINGTATAIPRLATFSAKCW